MSGLFVEKLGSGYPLVILHGWGTNREIWRKISQSLAEKFTVYLLDLPGMGKSPPLQISHQANSEHLLKHWISAITNVLPEQFYLLGWSLGGLLAMQIATEQKVKKLILLGATPCFVEKYHWIGMPLNDFVAFSKLVQQNTYLALQRFTMLMSDDRKELNEILRTQDKPADKMSLIAGLRILRDADLRASFKSVTTPLLVLQGEKDRLVRPQTTEYFQQSNSHAKIHVVEKASHAFFLSYADECIQLIQEFLSDDT